MQAEVNEIVAKYQALAQLGSAAIWAIAAVIVAIVLAPLVKKLVAQGRISKLSLRFVAVDLASARELQRSPQVMFLDDMPPGYGLVSYLPDLLKQFEDQSPIDYIVVDLGDDRGKEGGDDRGAVTGWLASRLHLFTLLLKRMRALQVVVFVHQGERSVRECIGIADADKVRWALAKEFPQLEQAYAMAYGGWQGRERPSVDAQNDDVPVRPSPRVIANTGAISNETASSLIENYMAVIQRDSDPRESEPNEKNKPWVKLPGKKGAVQQTDRWEATGWLTAPMVERLLGSDLNHAYVERSWSRQLLADVVNETGPFVALVDKKGRFERLIDRDRVLEAQVQTIVDQVS